MRIYLLSLLIVLGVTNSLEAQRFRRGRNSYNNTQYVQPTRPVVQEKKTETKEKPEEKSNEKPQTEKKVVDREIKPYISPKSLRLLLEINKKRLEKDLAELKYDETLSSKALSSSFRGSVSEQDNQLVFRGVVSPIRRASLSEVILKEEYTKIGIGHSGITYVIQFR